MNRPVLSPDDIKKAYALKTKTLYLVFVVVPLLAYAAYTIESHDLVERAFPASAGFTKNREEIGRLTAVNQKLKKQIETKDGLIELYKKKASRIAPGDESLTIEMPVLQARYISWETFQRRNAGVKFSRYREKQVEFLHGELDKARAFFDSLRISNP